MNGFSTIRELSKALREKKVSSVELTKQALQDLKTKGLAHNAVAELTEAHALEAARKADATEAKGPLHGIPYGAKDLVATKGIPTRWGSPGHVDQVFDYDATVVRKLTDAGAVLAAKLEMIELAGGGNYNVPDASRMGPCKSAWDPNLWAGGSSSGSGAAVGLGLVSYAIATETSGSIVCPSAFNGVTGLRPTYGRVSRHGAMALCWTLDKIGVIGRDAEDCALVVDAMSGHDPLDPTSLTGKIKWQYRGKKPRIGLLKEWFGPKAKNGEAAYHSAVEAFRKLGYETVEVAYPDLPYILAVEIIVDAEGASAHENFIRSERFQLLRDKHQIAGFAAGMETKAVDYLWAMRLRTEALKANAVWERCECIFTPAYKRKAVPIDRLFSSSWEDMGGDESPSNLLGWPAMAFPIGFDEWAPLGGQVIAPCLREDICLKVARDYQRATEWHLKRPS